MEKLSLKQVLGIEDIRKGIQANLFTSLEETEKAISEVLKSSEDNCISIEVERDNKKVTFENALHFDEEKKITYDFSSLDEVELAYAVTIHKSQGSEFPVVVIPVNYGPPMLMTRNLIYTAVTRAKKLVVLVGLKQSLYIMINNNTIAARYSGLKDRIINIIGLIK
jgi:exodeoxyribonuclease V alpha subunit